MKHLVQVDSANKIISFVSVLDEFSANYAGYIEVQNEPSSFDEYFFNGAFISRPLETPKYFAYDVATSSWFDPSSLSTAKARKWDAIKAERDAAEFGGFTWDGSPFDSSAVATQRIAGSVQMAVLSQMALNAFSIDWTLADNTVRSLNATQMIEVGQALAQHVAQCHSHGRELRLQIESAGSLALIDAVAW